MAIANEILVGRYNRFVQKLLGIKGGAPMPQVSGELQVALNTFSGVENAYLEGWDIFAQQIGVTGVAAQFSTYRLRNPVGSNVIAVFLKASSSGQPLADAPQLSTDTTSLDLFVTPILSPRLDTRGRPNCTLIASVNTAGIPAVALTKKYQVGYPANGMADFIIDDSQAIPLLPGDAIQMSSNVLAQNLFLTFVWRERYLEDSERK